MQNMLDRAMHYMERDIDRVYTMNELRLATGIAIRSQYRLSTQLLDSCMVERAKGGYRIAEHLRQARENRIVADYISEGLGEF